MADNTFNFDLDAPAVPTLTLDPTPAEEEKAAPAQQEAAAPEQPQVNLTPEEQAERTALRREYIDAFKQSLTAQLDNTYIQYPDCTKQKLAFKEDPSDGMS